MGFSQVVQLHIAGEDTHIHQRPAYGRRCSDPLRGQRHPVLGPAFTSDGFPRIDAARGGKMSSMIETVDYFVTVSRNGLRPEPVIPGRGPIATLPICATTGTCCAPCKTVCRRLSRPAGQKPDVLAAKPTAEFDAGTRTSHRRAVRYDGVRSRQQAITSSKVSRIRLLCLFLL
jgi:hypothetical protein